MNLIQKVAHTGIPLAKHSRTHVVNFLTSLFPDDVISSAYVRPFILRHFYGLRIGEGTVIWSGSHFANNNIEIGSDCFINNDCYFDADARIIIGDNVTLAHGVTIITTKHEIGDKRRRCSRRTHPMTVEIRSGSWIGANVTILPGVTIGEGVIVGAASVVTKSVPDDMLVVGVPAKIIKELPSGGTTFRDVAEYNQSD